jgi:hypothetical protein
MTSIIRGCVGVGVGVGVGVSVGVEVGVGVWVEVGVQVGVGVGVLVGVEVAVGVAVGLDVGVGVWDVVCVDGTAVNDVAPCGWPQAVARSAPRISKHQMRMKPRPRRQGGTSCALGMMIIEVH